MFGTPESTGVLVDCVCVDVGHAGRLATGAGPRAPCCTVCCSVDVVVFVKIEGPIGLMSGNPPTGIGCGIGSEPSGLRG